MRKFNYDYTDLKDEQYNQYEGIEFQIGKPVDAVYIKSPCSFDNGNPFIEALPRPRLDKEITRDYEKTIKDYKEGLKTEFQSLTEIALLRELRFKLPFYKSLELEHYSCLLNSYRARDFIVGFNGKSRMTGNTFDAAAVGYNLIGDSGSGKSSAMKILLSRYPQVINHHFEDIGEIKQITYIMITTTANDNFNSLYNSMARAIDEALGFVEPFYEKIMAKKKSLSEKNLYIESLINTFSIGIIVIDEIQLMSFSTAKENSYTSLARLSNSTKVPFCCIGLPDALQKMFSKDWTARRVGNTIDSSVYCENYEYFATILTRLSNYNWLKFPMQFTDDGTKTLFEFTNGAIAHMISFYMRLQLNNMNKTEPIIVDSECVKNIINKHFSSLAKILNNNKKYSKQEINDFLLEQMALTDEENKKLDLDIQRKAQEAEMKIQMLGNAEYEKEQLVKELEDYVIQIIKMFDSNKDEEQIKKCLSKVISKNKANIKYSKEDYLQLTLKELDKKNNKKKKEPVPISIGRMID